MNDTARPSPVPADLTAKDIANDVQEKTLAAARKVIQTVRKHPLETFAVAIGTGLLVWWLVNRHETAD